MGDLRLLGSRADPSWLRELNIDPESAANQPNKSSRQVKSGHYVLVRPTPLPQPYLIEFSPSMAAELRLTEEACRSPEFARFFSGDIEAIDGFDSSWATPYALSVFGQEMLDNCPFKNGNGYGDGRAISVGEVVVPPGNRWELQLKGAGQTPFCRGGDGRAVLRSSVREFLASEAMFHMGVETTRALSLVASDSEQVKRAWYTKQARPVVTEEMLAEAAPQLLEAPPEIKNMAMRQLRARFREMNVIQMEHCAITCRTAPSFIRVGHLELHARRARQGGEHEMNQLELLVRHSFKREFEEIDSDGMSLQQVVLALSNEFAKRLSRLVANWLRVGYCQGNFNSDNCLLGGRTMDYGPFGFIEKFDPLWNMWESGGEHYAFINQPSAAHRNFFSFVKSVAPLLSTEGVEEAQEILNGFPRICKEAVDDMWRQKLGLQEWGEKPEELLSSLLNLMAESSADYTILWRQLADVAAKDRIKTACNAELLEPILVAFYEKLTLDLENRWATWLQTWLAELQAQSVPSDVAAVTIRNVSPKYVPREWMLVEAYEAAEGGSHELVSTLQQLFLRPFDEQPAFAEKYYRKAPPAVERIGGLGFMS